MEKMQSISFSELNKKKYCIDDDESRVIEINPTDINIATRLSDGFIELKGLEDSVNELTSIELDTDEGFTEFSNKLADIDNKMRGIMNKIFDYDVCSVICPKASLYSVRNGKMFYEIIIEKLTKLYENNLDIEYKQMANRIKQRVSKYHK